MRKLMLISALLLVSASAHAGPSGGPLLAAADTPAATATDTPQPLPPVTHKDAPKPPVADTEKGRTPRFRVQARRYQSEEAKARRIAARYGISW